MAQLVTMLGITHQPDVLITNGNDHLHQFFMDNMPAFMIGKMDRFHGFPISSPRNTQPLAS